MSTSVHDLLQAIHDELDRLATTTRSPAAAQTALTSIAATNTILTGLLLDGVDRELASKREHSLTALHTATANIARATDGLPRERPAELIAVTGDAISRLSSHSSHADRWAFALAIGEVVRHTLDIYKANGSQAPNPHLEWARRAATNLARIGAERPPEPRHLFVQDRVIPAVTLAKDAAPLTVAANAIDTMNDALRRSSQECAPSATIAEVRAATTVALVSARYLTAISEAADPKNLPTREAVDLWAGLRRALAAVEDGTTSHTHSDLGIIELAARARDGLVRAFGPSDQISNDRVHALTEVDREHLRGIADQLPDTSELVRAALRDQRHLYAKASELEPSENRVHAWLTRRAVVIDSNDHAHLNSRLDRVTAASKQLAATANFVSREQPPDDRNPTTTRPEPNATTAATWVTQHRSPSNRRPNHVAPEAPLR